MLGGRERQFKQAALQHAIGDRIFEFVAGSHASNLITSSFLNHETNRAATKVLSFFSGQGDFQTVQADHSEPRARDRGPGNPEV